MQLFDNKKGFSLIEAAIVLGIIGLVIGGIWVAAEAVTSTNQANKANAYNRKIVQDLMHLYKGQQLPTTFTDLTSALIAANIIPPDMVSNGTAKTVWGGAFEIIIPSANQLKLSYYNVPQSGCAKFIIASVTQINPWVGSSQEGIFNVMVDATMLSMDPTTWIQQAGAACKLASQSTISFTYNVSRIPY